MLLLLIFKMSILIYKDSNATDEKTNTLIAKMKEKLGGTSSVKEIYTTSNVIKQISPTLLINSNKMTIPKFKMDDKAIEDIDMKAINNKENITTMKNLGENVIKKEEEDKEDEVIEVLEQEDEEQGRAELDKENLLKAFYFGMDPFESCIELNNEEDDEQFGLKYMTLQERLENMFDIKLQY